MTMNGKKMLDFTDNNFHIDLVTFLLSPIIQFKMFLLQWFLKHWNWLYMYICIIHLCRTCIPFQRGGCGRNRMVVGFATTYANSAYHH